jgi:hypothetical protein
MRSELCRKDGLVHVRTDTHVHRAILIARGSIGVTSDSWFVWTRLLFTVMKVRGLGVDSG